MNHTVAEGEKIIVRWLTKDDEAIRLIRKRFGIPSYTTVNGWSPTLLRPDDKEMFLETVRRGYFTYMPAEWSFNGQTFSW